MENPNGFGILTTTELLINQALLEPFC